MTCKEVHKIVDEALGRTKRRTAYANPLEAWSMFTDEVDRIGRRMIGDKLESEGKNRYTGKDDAECNAGAATKGGRGSAHAYGPTP